MKKVTLVSTLILLFSVTIMAQKAKQSKKGDEQKTETPAKDKEQMVLISTSLGDMKVSLSNATPHHRDNFIKLVNEHFYDSLLFHRVIQNFMIQGGDPLSKNAAPNVMLGNGDNGYTIPAEFVSSLYHRKGALCTARTPNPEKASSGCQFYIVQGKVYSPEELSSIEAQKGIKYTEEQKKIYTTVGGFPPLDQDYTVFGQVVEGIDVLDKIAAVKTNPGDRPAENVYILKMTLLK